MNYELNDKAFELVLTKKEDIIIKMINNHDIDKNVIDEDHRQSLLQWALNHNCIKLAVFLIKSNCLVNNNTIETALDIVTKRYPHDKQLYDFMRNHGALLSNEIPDDYIEIKQDKQEVNIYRHIEEIMKNKMEDLFIDLVKLRKININYKINNNTFLMLASKYNCKKIVIFLLLEKDFTLHDRIAFNDDKMTAYDIATNNEIKKILKSNNILSYEIFWGSSLWKIYEDNYLEMLKNNKLFNENNNIVDGFGYTVLMCVCSNNFHQNEKNNYIEIIKYIINSGCDINHYNYENLTTLDILNKKEKYYAEKYKKNKSVQDFEDCSDIIKTYKKVIKMIKEKGGKTYDELKNVNNIDESSNIYEKMFPKIKI
jgi:ankyrin repeat protein